MLKRLSCFLIALMFIFPGQVVRAQDAEPQGPVYLVQSGDTFYSIALQFNVSVDDLVAANPNVNPNALGIGQEVVIPGLVGVRGALEAQAIPLGESLRTLSIRSQVLREQIIRLNRLTSPAEVFAGASLIVPREKDKQAPESKYLLGAGQSLFQVAAQSNANPWLLAELNQTGSIWDVLPGEAVFDQAAATANQPADPNAPTATTNPADQVSLISPVIKSLVVDPLPIVQGETTVIKVTTTQPMELTGSLAGRALQFFPSGENTYVALQGVHAMLEPGIYPIDLQGKLQDGSQFSFEQMLILKAAGYISEKIDGVDPATLDPANTKPEEDQIWALVAKATPEKLWDGPFGVPGYDPNWITSTYGNRRAYNGGPYSFFHTGVDYGGGTGLPIKAPAPGVVVFAGFLTVRGNATIIDHGWGVYSGFYHQSKINVAVGDKVDTGQVIGESGGTGRITGPHLHWDLFVNGVQVNPLTWLERSFP